MSLAPQRNDSAPDLHIRTSRHVIIPRRSELWRSATLIAGPRVSLPLNRQLQTSCLVGLGRSPVRDLIAIMLDVPADSFALDVDVIMPAPVTALLAEAGKFTEQANHARPAGVSLRSWAQAPRRK
jgi:hypothetical protein